MSPDSPASPGSAPNGSPAPVRPPDSVAPESETPTWQSALLGDKALETEQLQSTEDSGRLKVLAGLRAAFALAGGYVIHELADGSFLVCWRNLTKPCPDLAAVRAFGHLVGAIR